MAVRIEKGGWIVIGLIGVGLVGYSLKKYGLLDKIAPSAKVQESTVPKRVDLPVLNPSHERPNVTAVPVPGTVRPAAPTSPRCACWSGRGTRRWGLMLATGGPQASQRTA